MGKKKHHNGGCSLQGLQRESPRLSKPIGCFWLLGEVTDYQAGLLGLSLAGL